MRFSRCASADSVVHFLPYTRGDVRGSLGSSVYENGVADSEWSSCYRQGRKIGAVIVKDKRIMTTGYNGAPAGLLTCKERGECLRDKLNVPSGTRTELCYAIHAEQNAILQAAKLGLAIDGATLYCTHQPCSVCAKMIINTGIRRVVYQEGYPDEFSRKFFEETGVLLERYQPDEMEPSNENSNKE